MIRRLVIVLEMEEHWNDSRAEGDNLNDPMVLADNLLSAYDEYSYPGTIIDAKWVD